MTGHFKKVLVFAGLAVIAQVAETEISIHRAASALKASGGKDADIAAAAQSARTAGLKALPMHAAVAAGVWIGMEVFGHATGFTC